MYNCPYCSMKVGDYWSKCEYCGESLVYKCPQCGITNYLRELECECGYVHKIKKYNKESKEKNENNQKYKNKSIIIEINCKICDNHIKYYLEKNFDVFFCEKCRTIYSIEIENKIPNIKIIKIGKKVLPLEIKKYLEILGIKESEITENELKIAWKRQIDLYHPDKVSHLGADIQAVAEKKTKELNEAYSKIKDWIKI